VQQSKREWVYRGLAVPPGSALVRSSTAHGEKAPRSVVFAGGAWAEPLRVPLSDMADGSKSLLSVFLREESSVEEWITRGWLAEAAASLPGVDAVLLGLTVDPKTLRLVLPFPLRSRIVWLLSPGAMASEAVTVDPPRGGMLTASEYASWAGSAWQALRR
jgi:hypothetical protein